MVICLAEEFHAAGVGKLAEAVDYLRSIAVKLLECGSRDREGYLELPLVLLDGFKQKLVHREVAFLRNSLEDGSVGKIIIIMRILTYIKKPVKAESGRLMNLEIQTD